jgi:hypothetical protein
MFRILLPPLIAKMVLMTRFYIGAGFFAAALTIFAQNSAAIFDKAPPEVEEALRARVAKFYQLQKDGKYRMSEQLVAEDSKDIFYVADKRQCFTFEIFSIKYSDEFSRAKVGVLCETDFPMPMSAPVRVKIPMPTTWKLDGGLWSWYVEPQKEVQTPFGMMRPPAPGAAGGEAAIDPRAGFARAPSVASLATAVKADVSELSLSKGAQGHVTLTNKFVGPVTLSVDNPSLTGFEAKLESTTVDPGKSVQLAIRQTGTMSPGIDSAVFSIRVRPTGQVLEIRARLKTR